MLKSYRKFENALQRHIIKFRNSRNNVTGLIDTLHHKHTHLWKIAATTEYMWVQLIQCTDYIKPLHHKHYNSWMWGNCTLSHLPMLLQTSPYMHRCGHIQQQMQHLLTASRLHCAVLKFLWVIKHSQIPTYVLTSAWPNPEFKKWSDSESDSQWHS